MTPKYLTDLPDPVDQGNGQWVVASRTVPGKRYVVTHRTGGWHCTCLGFKFSPWSKCNHCNRLKAYLATIEPTERQMEELEQRLAQQVALEFMI